MKNTETNEPHHLAVFEPVSIRVVDIAPRNVLCTSDSDTPESVGGLQRYNSFGNEF